MAKLWFQESSMQIFDRVTSACFWRYQYLVVTSHLVQASVDIDGSVEDPGVGMRVPSDNVNKVNDCDKLMDFDSNVPPGWQPVHAQRSQDGKEDGRFYHTKDIVNLEAHHLGLHVDNPWSLVECAYRATTQRYQPITIPYVCETRQQDAPQCKSVRTTKAIAFDLWILQLALLILLQSKIYLPTKDVIIQRCAEKEASRWEASWSSKWRSDRKRGQGRRRRRPTKDFSWSHRSRRYQDIE